MVSNRLPVVSHLRWKQSSPLPFSSLNKQIKPLGKDFEDSVSEVLCVCEVRFEAEH